MTSIRPRGHPGWRGAVNLAGAILAGICLATSFPTRAADVPPVGQIGNMSTPVRQGSTVERKTGKNEPAVRGLPLFEGDVVHVRPCTDYLKIIYQDFDDSLTLPNSGQCDYRVDRKPPMAPPTALWTKLEGIYGFLANRSPPSAPVPTYSQGGSGLGSGADLVPGLDGITRDEQFRRRAAVIPRDTRQKLTRDTAYLQLLWNQDPPPPYRVALVQAGRDLAVGETKERLDIPLTLDPLSMSQGAAEIIVSAGGALVTRIAIDVVDTAGEPLAPGLPATARGDPKAATLQGLWLLTEGGKEWRLRALAHLRESIVRNNDFQAARVLRAVLSGEWEPPSGP